MMDYTEYRRLAIQAGSSEEAADRTIEGMKRVDVCLDKLECPQCANVLTCAEDTRQAGATKVAGT